MRRTLTAVALAVAFAFLALLHAPTQGAAASYTVQIENYAYSSSSITVNVGDTITWTNDIRALSPVLLLDGLTAAIAVFCLLLVGSRAAPVRPDPDSDPGN